MSLTYDKIYILSSRVSPDDAIAQATTNSNCGSDHLMVSFNRTFPWKLEKSCSKNISLQIPGGSAQGIATNFQENPAGATTDPTLNKVCGRFLGTQAATAGASVCSKLIQIIMSNFLQLVCSNTYSIFCLQSNY